MKDGTCTRCGGEKLYEITEALMANPENINATSPLTLTAHYGPSGESGFFGDKMARTPVRISALVCAACAYTELYAKDLEVLATFARAGHGNVREVTKTKR